LLCLKDKVSEEGKEKREQLEKILHRNKEQGEQAQVAHPLPRAIAKDAD